MRRAEIMLAARQCEAALAQYDRAQQAGADPERCDAGRWMAHMLGGNYGGAWQVSDAIRARGVHDPNRFWQGEPLAGKRVMLRCLHGYGDTVMYLRWLPMLLQCADSVTVQAAPEVLPLLAAVPGTQRVITWNSSGSKDIDLWDVQVECAELPYLFRATAATLPPPTHFAFSEAASHRVRLRLGQRTRPRVGLVWTGSGFDPLRSLPFSLLQQGILAHHDFEFWSLQPPSGNAAWTDFCTAHGWSARTFYTTSEAGDPQHAGMADMAAFTAELDLVLTIDTFAAHLAGSLGIPTLLMLKHAADWRWMLDRDDTPWYPGVKLYRQAAPDDWTTVLDRVCDQLRDWNEETQA